jgi:hypothetical protein
MVRRSGRTGVLVSALVVALAGCAPNPDGGETTVSVEPSNARPAGQPSPPFTERFDSPLHGLSIGYPSGWRRRAATEPWGHDEIAFGAPGVDVIFDPTLRDDLYFAVVSEPLDVKSGSRVHEYRQPFDLLPSVGICKAATGGGGGSDTLDGARGWFQQCGTPFGTDSVATVATATRGYIIYLHVGEKRAAVAATRRIGRLVPARYEGDWFLAALVETVDLHPEDASTRRILRGLRRPGGAPPRS